MRDEDDRRAIVDETLERRKEFVDLVGHQHGGRLVEDQDVGAAVENLDDLHPLAFTDTELGYELVEIELGADLLHDLGDAAASGGEIDAATAPAGLTPEDDVLTEKYKENLVARVGWILSTPILSIRFYPDKSS